MRTQNRFVASGILHRAVLLLLLLLLAFGCSLKQYKPYHGKQELPPPNYPGRMENRRFSVDRFQSPGKVISEENRLDFKMFPADAVLEPVKDRFEFSDTANYRLGPGDVLEIIYQLKAVKRDEPYRINIMDDLEITFYYTPQMNRKETVRVDGKINLIMIGEVDVYGKTTVDVGNEITKRYSKFLKDPIVEVSVVKSNWAIEELKRAITTAPRGQSRLEPVRPDGFISLPLIGDIQLGGLTVPQASAAILEKYKAVGVLDIDVTVVLLEVKAPLAYVMGAVLRPGPVVVQEHDDVWRTIALQGGFSNEADRRHVLVAKSGVEGERRFVLDFEKWRMTFDPAENTTIRRGDIIYVPKAVDRFVYVLGSVEKPGRIPLDAETGITASQAVAMGGRINAGANESQILVLRRGSENEPIVLNVDLKAIMNPRNYDNPKDYSPRDPMLQPGDLVYVPNSIIGDIDRFAQTYFKDGLWTIVPADLTAVYQINSKLPK